jgi:vacuolar-type H+-ATPase subunit H
MDDILAGILSIEAEAKAIVSEARQLSTLLKEQAHHEAQEIRTGARTEAESEAQALHERTQKEIEQERARILSQTDGQPQPAAGMAHFQEAVDHVVAVVSGREEEAT